MAVCISQHPEENVLRYHEQEKVKATGEKKLREPVFLYIYIFKKLFIVTGMHKTFSEPRFKRWAELLQRGKKKKLNSLPLLKELEFRFKWHIESASYLVSNSHNRKQYYLTE